MDLRPDFLIKTVIKAMTDVVLPAVDQDNKLAQEQTRLVIGMLQLTASRLPMMYRFDCDELSRSLALADTLQKQAKELSDISQSLHALAISTESGQDVLARALAEPAELEAANFDLREKISALITAIYATNAGRKLQHIGTTVTEHAKEQLLRDRAFLISQGWEPDPKSIPAIETLIGSGPSTH